MTEFSIRVAKCRLTALIECLVCYTYILAMNLKVLPKYKLLKYKLPKVHDFTQLPKVHPA